MNHSQFERDYDSGESYLGQKRWIDRVWFACFLLAAGYMGTRNFLFFHAFTESLTVIISFTIAVIVLNTYTNSTNSFISIIGIAYFCAGFFDFLHLLSYDGMNIISEPGGTIATQMWIIARYLDSVGMLLAGISFHRAIKPRYVLVTYGILSITALMAVFYWRSFPEVFIPGRGLTPFKVYSEYLISLILIASIVLLFRHKSQFRPPVFQSLILFFLLSICTELSFTFYKVMDGLDNIIGHFFRITAYFFLYQSVVKTNLTEPYVRLQDSRKQLWQFNSELEDIVKKRTQELQNSNARLENEIEERRAAQETVVESRNQLLLSQLRYQALFNYMQNAFAVRKVIVDEDGRTVDLEYTDVNPAYEKLYDMSADEIVGRRMKSVFPDFEKESFDWIQVLGTVAITGEPVTFEQYFQFADKWLHIDAYSPVDGYVATVIQDITESKLSKEKLERYSAELAETNKEIRYFVNAIAHDFRAPMVNLKGFSKELVYSLTELRQILQNGELDHIEKTKRANTILERDVSESLQYINSSVDRLDRMITALLKLERLGRRDINYSECDMNELVNTVLQSFHHQIDTMKIRIGVESLPRIVTDQLAVEQIVGNLLDNAIKYLKPDCKGEITIKSITSAKEIVFTIEDNGRGIPEADQEKIFEIFRRAGKQDVPGDGMGLTFVKTLVRQLGGKVWCHSEEGIGTKMSFSLPIVQASR